MVLNIRRVKVKTGQIGRVLLSRAMLRRLKQIVPLPLRTRLKWLGYAGQDIAGGKRPPRVPPKRKVFIGGGDFIVIGDAFFKTLKRHGLTPDMDVLDVGCGQGRMARPLAGYLESGSYQGFDIDKAGIAWCQKEYTDAVNFKFIHADVYNLRYNKRGTIQAKDYSFPFADNSFDHVFLTSVFTHMFAEDVAQYLSEVARVLRPGGRCLITWFLLDEASRHAERPIIEFVHDVDDVSKTTTRKNPEAAIAFDMDYVHGLYQLAGLRFEALERGYWSRIVMDYDYQDLIIAVK